MILYFLDIYETFVKEYDMENNKTFTTYDFIKAATEELGKKKYN